MEEEGGGGHERERQREREREREVENASASFSFFFFFFLSLFVLLPFSFSFRFCLVNFLNQNQCSFYIFFFSGREREARNAGGRERQGEERDGCREIQHRKKKKKKKKKLSPLFFFIQKKPIKLFLTWFVTKEKKQPDKFLIEQEDESGWGGGGEDRKERGLRELGPLSLSSLFSSRSLSLRPSQAPVSWKNSYQSLSYFSSTTEVPFLVSGSSATVT